MIYRSPRDNPRRPSLIYGKPKWTSPPLKPCPSINSIFDGFIPSPVSYQSRGKPEAFIIYSGRTSKEIKPKAGEVREVARTSFHKRSESDVSIPWTAITPFGWGAASAIERGDKRTIKSLRPASNGVVRPTSWRLPHQEGKFSCWTLRMHLRMIDTNRGLFLRTRGIRGH